MLRCRTRSVAHLGAEAGALVALLHAGRPIWATWAWPLRRPLWSSSEDAIVAVALVAGVFVLGAMAFATIVELAVTPPKHVARRVPRSRRLVTRLTGSCTAAYGLLATTQPPLGAQLPAQIPPATAHAYVPKAAGELSVAAASKATTEIPARHHVVEAGESLWTIAEQNVAQVSGIPLQALQPSDVAPYWQKLVDRNATLLASGEPDLVFPGEIIVLP